MNRRILLSLFAVALMAFGTSVAQATVDFQLNLRYNDPADPTEGGSWDLLAQTDSTNGLAGYRVVLRGITDTAGGSPIAADNTGITYNAILNDWHDGAANSQSYAAAEQGFNEFDIEIVAGEDLEDGGGGGPILVQDVGTGGSSLGNVADDDLFLGGPSSGWNDSALLASGFFGATRPEFVPVDPTDGPNGAGGFLSGGVLALANDLDDTTPAGMAQASTLGIVSVRGDSEVSLGLESPAGAGLLPGDSDRDGIVGPADLALVGLNFDITGSGNGWGDGDFDDDGVVGPADLAAVGLNFDITGSNTTPPALNAVPEPSSLLLFTLALGGICARRRFSI